MLTKTINTTWEYGEGAEKLSYQKTVFIQGDIGPKLNIKIANAANDSFNAVATFLMPDGTNVVQPIFTNVGNNTLSFVIPLLALQQEGAHEAQVEISSADNKLSIPRTIKYFVNKVITSDIACAVSQETITYITDAIKLMTEQLQNIGANVDKVTELNESLKNNIDVGTNLDNKLTASITQGSNINGELVSNTGSATSTNEQLETSIQTGEQLKQYLEDFKAAKESELTEHANEEIRRINETGVDNRVKKTGDTMTGLLNANGGIKINGNKVYNEGFKPTAADVGAISNMKLGIQRLDYRKSVVGLVKLSADKQSTEEFYMGNVVACRGNALYGALLATMYICDPYIEDKKVGYSLHGALSDKVRPCTFTKNGITYGGFEFFPGDASYGNVYLQGVLVNSNNNMPYVKLDYASSRGDVYDSEIANSINFGSAVERTANYIFDSEIYANKTQRVYHQGFKPTTSDICPYRVGDILTTTLPDNPAVTWVGTTWQKIEGKYLKGTSGISNAKQTGGSNTKTLSVANMPAHNHRASQSAHLHSGVSYNALNQFQTANNEGSADAGVRTLPNTGWSTWGWTGQWGSNKFGLRFSKATFTSGNTGGAQPAITVGNTGSGTPFNIEPEYYLVNFWLRIS